MDSHWVRSLGEIVDKTIITAPRIRKGLHGLYDQECARRREVKKRADLSRFPYVHYAQDENWGDIARCMTCNVMLDSAPSCTVDGEAVQQCSRDCPEPTTQRGCPLQPHPNNEQQRTPLNTCQGKNGQKKVSLESHRQLMHYEQISRDDIFKVPRLPSDSASTAEKSCSACRATAWRSMLKSESKCTAKLTSARQCQVDCLSCYNDTTGVCAPHSAQGQDRSHGYQPQILFSGHTKIDEHQKDHFYLNTPLQLRPLVELILVAWLQGMEQADWPTEITADHMCQIAEWWEFSSGTRSKKEPVLRICHSSALGSVKRTRLVARIGRYLYKAFGAADAFPPEFEGVPKWEARATEIQKTCGFFFSHHDRKRWDYDNKYRTAFPSVVLEPVESEDTSEDKDEVEVGQIVARMITMRTPDAQRGDVEAALRLHDSMRALGSSWENHDQERALAICSRRAQSGTSDARRYMAAVITEIINNNQEQRTVADVTEFILTAISVVADLRLDAFDKVVNTWQVARAPSLNALPPDVGNKEEVDTALEVEHALKESEVSDPSDDREETAEGKPGEKEANFKHCMEDEWSADSGFSVLHDSIVKPETSAAAEETNTFDFTSCIDANWKQNLCVKHVAEEKRGKKRTR